MTERGVRIISLEANKIYEQIEKNGEETGFILPEKPKTQKEAAQMLGISRSYVSRIEKSALDKLRDALGSE